MVRPPGFVWSDRECEGCGASYTPTGANQRRCSNECPGPQECSRCHEEKPPSEFYRQDGRLQVVCKTCRLADVLAAWHSRTPERVELDAVARWERSLRRKFNIEPADYWRMFQEQDGRCRICHRSLDEINSEHFKHFSVDHDRHCCPGDASCGRCIRGLLCAKCNGSLGWYEQFPAEIAAYLAVHKEVVLG